jgi:Zn finger protein HypA/HybF involved in hydrogenase expression
VIKGTVMPEELKNTYAEVLCNECLEKSEVKFHYYGIKCKKCKSFNTKILKTFEKEGVVEELDDEDKEEVMVDDDGDDEF